MDSASAIPRPESSHAVRVLLALSASCKALRFYPPTNPQVKLTLDRLRQALTSAIGLGESLVLQVERERFVSAGSGIPALDNDLTRLAFKLHCLNVREIELLPGSADEELVALAFVLNQ